MVSRCRLARGAVESDGLWRPTLMQACAAGEARWRLGVARYPSPLERKRGLPACRRRRKAQAGSEGWRGGAGGNALPALRLARIDRSEVGSRVVVCCRSRLAGFLAQRSGWPHLNRFGSTRGRAPSSRSTSARKCAARG